MKKKKLPLIMTVVLFSSHLLLTPASIYAQEVEATNDAVASRAARAYLNAELRQELVKNARILFNNNLNSAFSSVKPPRLGSEVGSEVKFSVSFPTYSVAYGNGGDWIARIAGNEWMGVPYYTRMYYGNHERYRGEFSIKNFSARPTNSADFDDVAVSSEYSVVGTTATVNVVVRRLKESSKSIYPLYFRFENITLGSTVVAPVDPQTNPAMSVTNVTISPEDNFVHIPTILDETMTIKYLDEKGQSIRPTETKRYELGTQYNIKQPEINGYFSKGVSEKSSPLSGVIEEQKNGSYLIEFLYRTQIQGGDVIVKHQDEQGNELKKPVKHGGFQGESYTTNAEQITGWQVKEIKGEAQGVYTDKAKEVIYVYERVQGGDVTVKHQDELGNSLHASISHQGLYGTPYKTKAETIRGWKVKEVKGKADGLFDLERKEVIYVYERVQGGDVTIKHQDVKGNELHKPSKHQGLYGEAYKTSEEMITGWKVKEIKGEAQGVYTDKAKEVIYVYERVQGGDVIVHHQDELGNPLYDSISQQGLYGTPYKTKAETIQGWQVKEIKGEADGLFDLESKEVTYVYERAQGGDVTVKHQDAEGNELHQPSKLQGAYGEAYETSEEMITGWQVKEIKGEAGGLFDLESKEVTYVYERVQGGDVIVHYQDELGKSLHDSISHQGLYGKTYTTKAETISGWKVKEVKGKIKGTYTLDNQEVTYVYKKAPTESNKKAPASSNKKAATTPKQKTKKTLPKTGEQGSLMVSLMGLLLVICSIFLVVKKKPETK